MMGRWGLEGMQSFEQVSVARKEGAKLQAQGLGPGSELESHPQK
jgi:biotin synthase